MIKVCKLVALARIGGQFDSDPNRGRVLRDNMKVSEQYLRDVNSCTNMSGKVLIVDEEATKQWKEEHEDWREEMRANAAAKDSVSGEALIKALTKGIKSELSEDKPKRGRKKKEEGEQ